MSYINPSGPPSYGSMYDERFNSNINYETETGASYDPAPTHSIVGHWDNESQTASQRNLDGEVVEGPSRSDMRHGDGVISATGNNSGFIQSDAPNIDLHIRPNHSQPPGQEIPYNVAQAAPGMSGQGRQNHSETAQNDDQSPPQNYIGISLVGKKFKEVNPTAYYVDK